MKVNMKKGEEQKAKTPSPIKNNEFMFAWSWIMGTSLIFSILLIIASIVLIVAGIGD